MTGVGETHNYLATRSERAPDQLVFAPQRDDEAVLDQALGSLACLENHDQMYLSLQLGALRMLDLARQPKTQNYRSGQPDG